MISKMRLLKLARALCIESDVRLFDAGIEECGAVASMRFANCKRHAHLWLVARRWRPSLVLARP